MTRLNIHAAALAAARVEIRNATREAYRHEQAIADLVGLSDCGHRIVDSEDYRIEVSRLRGVPCQVQVTRRHTEMACAEG